MYASYLWLRTELVGRAATLLAAFGALGVVAGLALGALQSGAARIGLYEGTALFSAAAVLAYLGIERAYGSRSAGILVMPAVMVAVLCEMWLIGHGLAMPGRPPNGLAAYWEANRFAIPCPLRWRAGWPRSRSCVAPGRHPVGWGAVAAFSLGAPRFWLAPEWGRSGRYQSARSHRRRFSSRRTGTGIWSLAWAACARRRTPRTSRARRVHRGNRWIARCAGGSARALAARLAMRVDEPLRLVMAVVSARRNMSAS